MVNQSFKNQTCSPIVCRVFFTLLQAGMMFLCAILEKLLSQSIFLAMISSVFRNENKLETKMTSLPQINQSL